MAEELQQFADEDPAGHRQPKTRDVVRRQLASRAGIPVPKKSKPGRVEIAARHVSFIDKTPEEMALLTAKLVKASCAAAFASLRAVRDLQAVVDLNSSALASLQQDLQQVRRATARLDRPLDVIETTDNPELNPHLAGNIPFNDMQTTVEFLRSTERTTALMRYVWVQVKWSESNFPSDMVRLLFTYDFRTRYDYPGGLQYRERAYLTEKLKNFLINVTSYVARKSGGHFDRAKVERQLRTNFQASQVAKERAKDAQRKVALARAQEEQGEQHEQPARRKRPADAHQDSDDDEDDDEPALKRKKGKKGQSKNTRKMGKNGDEPPPAAN